MVQDSTFDYLVDTLESIVRDTIQSGYGEEDSSPKKDKTAQLCEIFEQYIYLKKDGFFRYSKSGSIWVFNGKHYEQVETKTFVKEIAKSVLRNIRVGLVYQKFSPQKISEECMSGLENRAYNRFEPNRRYIVFNNGVFDVKTGELLDFDYKYQTDIVLDIDYNPSARMSLWDEKIVSIIPNEQMREAFQMFCGMLLVNRDEIKMEYICFVLGPGSNGKSVITDAIMSVFGDAHFSKFQPDQLLKHNNSMFNLASLENKIAVFVDDLKKDNISTTGFKSFASGDKFEARHPFGSKVFKVKAPLMMCCANEMPPTTDDSWGYHRRILPIYSSTRIYTNKTQNVMLTQSLRSAEARTAIFNWIYEGYKKIMANNGKINLGDDVIEAQISLRDDSNSVRRWIRDEGLVAVEGRNFGDSAWKTQGEWHKKYRDYCLENGDRNPQNSKSMSKIFKEKEFVSKRRSDGMWWCIGTLGVDTAENGDNIGNGNTPFGGALPNDEELPF